ncbi:hypothetical protein A3SI_17292 [Nitritalea halalkaliphila LW7]|uniref:Uncharacterized protein n=1 Tax=Nitritalea halalkaliphila LW7 TaxID=1189621 RepID=I5BVY2_9BACT|nr:hypothetical protein A3SI_17292 [Nitritalea halalkaliphila LW7]
MDGGIYFETFLLCFQLLEPGLDIFFDVGPCKTRKKLHLCNPKRGKRLKETAHGQAKKRRIEVLMGGFRV